MFVEFSSGKNLHQPHGIAVHGFDFHDDVISDELCFIASFGEADVIVAVADVVIECDSDVCLIDG